jgi:hypothetical protein
VLVILTPFLPACAILAVPAVVTGQELIRDRKGEFENRLSTMIGADLTDRCDSPRRPGELIYCGKLVRTTNNSSGRELTFEIAPPGCSYALTIESTDKIASWRYVSEPAQCWKFFLAPP